MTLANSAMEDPLSGALRTLEDFTELEEGALHFKLEVKEDLIPHDVNRRVGERPLDSDEACC